ncbi:kelch domain-containing protein 4 isoform X2 [Ooceraea biroi]|uniref:kelch domain-containing protein 4 isoform X2 n=1 Tax=Ooceraea biroi TaxID=2015173 RepID=UPI0005B822C3|nr:kelch domain-containing protein 4 isoform X2 [Ooceraea biroi]
MGKKDKNKNKNKISGSIKTALKTEKKLNVKQKKELAALGEDDIEKVVAEIEREEAHRQRVKEAVIDAPSRRVNFSLTAHPFKNELVMFGGEFHDGRQTLVYGDLFFYNTNKQEWTIVKAPGAPPPRCGHQAAATTNHSGELWIFGGEFTSPSESQYYHYRDLWVFRFTDKKWEKITAPNGPSARSGHRMIHVKKQLIVFGGFHDNLRNDYKYFNDVHIFDLETYTWQKIETVGVPPAPRSGCILLPTADGSKLIVYGGYSKEKAKKDVDRGQVHTDMFLLTQDKNNAAKYKWSCAKQTGVRVSPRCGASATSVQSAANQAFVFGGVHDEDDENEENLRGTFYNDLFALDLGKLHWRVVTLSEKTETSGNAEERRRRRRKKHKEENDELEESGTDSDEEILEKCSEQSAVSIDDDGIFTMTVGPAVPLGISSLSLDSSSAMKCSKQTKFFPSPRINAGMAIKNNILYIYGGIVEEDYRKLDEWKTLMADDLSSQTWFDSSEDSEDSEEDSEEECDNELVDDNGELREKE